MLPRRWRTWSKQNPMPLLALGRAEPLMELRPMRAFDASCPDEPPSSVHAFLGGDGRLTFGPPAAGSGRGKDQARYARVDRRPGTGMARAFGSKHVQAIGGPHGCFPCVRIIEPPLGGKGSLAHDGDRKSVV